MNNVHPKIARQVASVLREASLEAQRAAECMSAAQECIGFAGTVRGDLSEDLGHALASLRCAHEGIALAQRALQPKASE